MANLERRRKILFSTPVLFLLYAIPFSTLQFIGSYNPHPSLVLTASFGVLFGILMTAVTKRRLQKFNSSTGLSEPMQQWALHDTVRTGTLPTDPGILKAMPAYIEKRIKTNRQAKIYSTAFLILIFIANGCLAIAGRNLNQGLITMSILIIAILNYFTTSKQAKKLESLQKQLKPT